MSKEKDVDVKDALKLLNEYLEGALRFAAAIEKALGEEREPTKDELKRIKEETGDSLEALWDRLAGE